MIELQFIWHLGNRRIYILVWADAFSMSWPIKFHFTTIAYSQRPLTTCQMPTTNATKTTASNNNSNNTKGNGYETKDHQVRAYSQWQKAKDLIRYTRLKQTSIPTPHPPAVPLCAPPGNQNDSYVPAKQHQFSEL